MPEVENIFHYIFVIPSLGLGALFWSLFFGVGEVVIILALLSSYLFFKRAKFLFLINYLFLGAVGGMVFRLIST